ncbi:tyrosine-type recombinase/integrase [Microlunatus capsulatus]|uniref:Site-specific recombinase XerD n=1 Tax=Microlunatus capsulatus TaxID=99117 RepID=A0ABS4ZDF0_9ACTN|nr:tyrosine-type recombinase/integrase [Microlunatus capsulatus]MBP2419009.1 site-specific recombinase XerD [Microlunatus capsulatus]
MAPRLQDLERSFLRHLRAEGLSPGTLRLYGQSVTFFSRWLEAEGRTATLDELNRPAIREWLAGLNERQEAGTVKTRYRGLFRFCGWLVDEQELEENPMRTLSPPVLKAKPVPVITDLELAALLKACAGKEFSDRRDEAMVRLLLDCGVRVAELCGLTVDGVDLDQGMALVLGKGSKVRPVYFSARTVRALDRYQRMRRSHRWAHLDALFLTQRGGMSTDGARERVRLRGEQAGITDLHPHRFRHTFAHDFLMSGGQERDLKRLAGWSSDAMLERYGASAADARAKAAAQRLKRGDRV